MLQLSKQAELVSQFLLEDIAEMSAVVRFERVKQCAQCLWKKGVNLHEIPNGYSVEQHKTLASAIAER